jgi:hypothetical protein
MKFGKPLRALCFVIFLPGLARAADGNTLVYFDQPESARLFDQADVKGHFWTLARYFISQRIDTFCSVASSVMVLNALEVPAPISRMTYPYSKFNEETFFTEGVLARQRVRDIAGDGLFLAELGDMLKAFDLAIAEYHADSVSADDFRRLAIAALKSTDRYVVVNFSRDRIRQEGGGHFSPLAAYDTKSDRFLVLDTARYKYPPFWVQAQDLWEAMNTRDEAAKAIRGFLIIGRARK